MIIEIKGNTVYIYSNKYYNENIKNTKNNNGGVGSGIKGHTTPKEEKDKKYKTSEEEIKKKQEKVKIDFTKDNYLPELNKEDLEDLGKESKPILLKKNIIDRNKERHPEVREDEYNLLISKALYEPNYIFSGHNPKYTNFISKLEDGKNSTVLIEMSEENENYEIVHLHKIRDKNLEKMKNRDDK